MEVPSSTRYCWSEAAPAEVTGPPKAVSAGDRCTPEPGPQEESGGGTDDTIILRALEDAWNLGADVVNLSVGTGAAMAIAP